MKFWTQVLEGAARYGRVATPCSKRAGAVKRSPAKATIALLAAVLLAGAAPARARDPDRPTPSGLPVPRWVSLKFEEVRARSGPGDDYAVVWVYHARGLPVQVVEETREWRKICDPDGGSAWVNRRLTDGRRTLYRAAPGDLPFRDQPKDQAGLVARLTSRAVADFDRAEGDWVRLRAGGRTGWARAAELWGAAESAQCR